MADKKEKLIKNILDESKAQHRTCMYSEQDLNSFSEDKLNIIYAGIYDLRGRESWKRSPRRKNVRALNRFIDYCEKEKKYAVH